MSVMRCVPYEHLNYSMLFTILLLLYFSIKNNFIDILSITVSNYLY